MLWDSWTLEHRLAGQYEQYSYLAGPRLCFKPAHWNGKLSDMFPSLEPPTWGVYLILSTYCSSNILKSLPDQTSMTIFMADADNGVERFPHCRTSFPMTSTEMITSWRSPQVLTPHWSLLWCWHMRRWSKPTTADSALVTSETPEISETGRECRATLLMCRSGCTFKIFQEDHAQLHMDIDHLDPFGM